GGSIQRGGSRPDADPVLCAAVSGGRRGDRGGEDPRGLLRPPRGAAELQEHDPAAAPGATGARRVKMTVARPERLDAVLAALADPTPRAVVERLFPGGGMTVGDLAEPVPISNPAISRHL